jgi:hypothetical protein
MGSRAAGGAHGVAPERVRGRGPAPAVPLRQAVVTHEFAGPFLGLLGHLVGPLQDFLPPAEDLDLFRFHRQPRTA